MGIINKLLKILKSLIFKIKHLATFFIKKYFQTQKVVLGKYGIKYNIQPESALDNAILENGVLDDWESLKKVGELLSKNSTILDIGANVGMLSMLFAKQLVPNGNVYAYEPDSENLKQLNKNLSLNNFSNVHVVVCALQNDSSKDETTFYIRRAVDGHGHENRGLSSLKNIKKFTKQSVVVPVSTIDKEVARLNLTSLDLIKIDVEGAEYLVLQGGPQSIAKFLPIIQYEYSNVLDKLSGENNAKMAFLFLKQFGYKQYATDLFGKLTELFEPNQEMKDCNVIAIHSNKFPNFIKSI